MTEGAVLDYARLKPSHLNHWLPARLPDLPSPLQTERNNLPPYFTSFLSCFTHPNLPPPRSVWPHRATIVTSWLPLWMFRAQELSGKVIEKVSGSLKLPYFSWWGVGHVLVLSCCNSREIYVCDRTCTWKAHYSNISCWIHLKSKLSRRPVVIFTFAGG